MAACCWAPQDTCRHRVGVTGIDEAQLVILEPNRVALSSVGIAGCGICPGKSRS